MIENISYPGENGVLIEADVNGLHKKILFSDIEPYWGYSNEDEFEGGRAEAFDDFIMFTISAASGQGGIIVIWDVNKNCVLHISEASYCVAFSIYNEFVYTLCGVSNFVTPFHYELYATPIFTKDAWKKGSRLYCQHPCRIEEIGTNTEKIKVDNNGIQVIINDTCYNYSDTPDITALSSYNEEYSWLYDVFINDPSTHKFENCNFYEIKEKIDLSKKKVFMWLT